MLKSAVLVVSVTSAAALPDWAKLVQNINSDPSSTWTATVPNERTLSRVHDLAGGFIPLSKQEMDKVPVQSPKAYSKGVAPASYDARESYPFCQSIKRIRDQCACGSCFVFGSIEAFEDRICIHRQKNVTLSAEDILSCHTDENFSCDGGNPIAVWQNVFAGTQSDDGAINDSCYPYTGLAPCPCNHHSKNSTLKNCPAENALPTPQCDLSKKFACQDKGVFKSQTPVLIPAKQMEQEIFENGPITVAFNVYEDFLTYTSGVYKRSPTAKELGGHTVKIVGYGVEGTSPYWSVANSWNAEWGDAGFFKIARGIDECGIESLAVVAGLPTV